MAATETSTASSVDLRPLSPSQRLEKILRLKRRSTATTPRPFASLYFTRKRRKCSLCTPTTHPGSYRCDVHRRLANDKIDIISLKRKRRKSAITKIINSALNEKIGTLAFKPKRRTGGIRTSDSGLNLRKTAMANSLAGIESVEAERCRKYLKESMVKPLSLRFRCRFRPPPRPSRFYALHKDQD